MARIASFFETPTESTRVHDDVDCGYRMFSAQGERYVQLDTYGLAQRAIPGKVSQSIQLDRSAAEKLVKVFARAFPGICQEQ